MTKKKQAKHEDGLPSLKQLVQGPVLLTCEDGCHRQLRAAGLRDDVQLRLKLATVSEPGDAEEWEERRKKLGDGYVVCPACAVSDGDSEGCMLCEGKGLVARATWDEWYFAEKSCAKYKNGCEVKCKRRRCPYDLGTAHNSTTVLVLEMEKKGRWVARGNSLDGFKIAGLCKNILALVRFLNLVIETTDVMNFGNNDEAGE
jgi:hypothetical protein